MTDPHFQAVPVFRIFDPDKARSFYLDFLDMSPDWEHRFDEAAPLYMQVSRGALKLHLTEHHGDCCPGSTVYVETGGLSDYRREIAAKGYGFMRPGIEPAPWGDRIMEIIDPFGNRLRGTNENTNGLLRQYFPKGCDFRAVSDHDLAKVTRSLNHRPRKCLGYKTPQEVMTARLGGAIG